MVKSDLEFMRMAMHLAGKARGETSPNPMVGALIVKDGRILAQGFHRRCGTDHAEIVAIKKAKALSRGATLYVTLEPCRHYGRTPPCVERIISAGIKRVVVGMKDPNPLMDGKSIAQLREAGIEAKVGVLEKELARLNEVFVKFIQHKMPFVVAKSAQSIDGKIALANGRSEWITSSTARAFAHRLRNDFDAILVGINTILIDNPYLNATKKTKKIKKIVVDSQLRLPLKANIFQQTKPQDIIIATTNRADKDRLKNFGRSGVQLMICPGKEEQVDLAWLLRQLAKQEITSVLIEGGAAVIGSALKAKLVDKMLIYIAPKILGDSKARNSVEGLSPRSMAELIELKQIRCRPISGDFLVEGYL